MTSLVKWLCSQVHFCSLWRNYFVIEKAVNVVWSPMVWAILDCPVTEQNVNIKGAIFNFQKVGVWVQVLPRVPLNARRQKFGYWWIFLWNIHFFSFLMLWRHRSRDQNGPKFNIRSKCLLKPFSKNIFKRICSLINSVLKNGQRTGLAFSLNGTLDDFFWFFFMAAVCSGTRYTWESRLIQIVVAVC